MVEREPMPPVAPLSANFALVMAYFVKFLILLIVLFVR